MCWVNGVRGEGGSLGHDSSDVGWVSLATALGCMGWWLGLCAGVGLGERVCGRLGGCRRTDRTRAADEGSGAWLRRPEAMGVDRVGCVWIHAGGRGGNWLWRA